MNQRPTLTRLTAAITLTLVLATAPSQATVSAVLNGSFEDGAYYGGALNFAGGTAQVIASRSSSIVPVFPNLPFEPWIGGWAPSTVTAVNWVHNPTSARDGSKYLYLNGGDTCLNLLYGGTGALNRFAALTPGVTYELSFDAASAQNVSSTIPVSQELRVEDATGNTAFNLPANGDWSDTATSAIPWQQYTYQFTPTSSTGSFAISTGITGSAFVIDNIKLGSAPAPVPEPTTSLTSMVAALAMAARRRRH